MFQKFNDDNMLTKFIKNLLFKTYIPTVQIWKPGKPVIKDFVYITENYIVKALKNWTSKDIDNNDGPNSIYDTAYFKILEPYVKNRFYRGITSNYESNTSNYDSETHYYLGQYLRMIRDLDGINLMPYYNCWDGSYSDKIRFKLSKISQDTSNDTTTYDLNSTNHEIKIVQNNKKSDGLKTLLVPIKFNTKYTIYIDSNIPFTVCPAYFDGINIIPNSSISHPTFYKKISRCAFNSPYLYEGVTTHKNNLNANTNNMTTLFEDYLILLIQLPELNTSSVVILEGDYTKTSLINILKGEIIDNKFVYTTKLVNKLPKVIFGDTNLNSLPEADFENYFKSVPALTRTVDGKNYAFSNRLIEYLLMNVISKNDEIAQNIERIQSYSTTTKNYILNGKNYAFSASQKGIWDRYLRKYIYDLVTEFKLPLSFDINGYVDKDTEEIILRGKE